jgi:hypothetical protein
MYDFCGDFELPYVAISRVLEDFQGEVAGGLTPPRPVPSLFKTPRYGGYTKKNLNPFALINKHNHSTIASAYQPQLHLLPVIMASNGENGVKHTYALSETHKDVSCFWLTTPPGAY